MEEERDKMEKLDHRLVHAGRVVTLVVDRIREPGGKEVDREVVRHSGAAVMLAVTNDNRLVLVRQYRYAVDRHLWEVPAGTMSEGERPEETALRELVEETGFYPNLLEKLVAFYPSPGFSDEIMHVFLATELEERTACPDEDETIELGLFTSDEISRMVSQAEIQDGKTILGFMLLRERGIF